MNADILISLIRSMNKILQTINEEQSQFLDITKSENDDTIYTYFKLMDKREKNFKAYVIFNRRFSQIIEKVNLSEKGQLTNSSSLFDNSQRSTFINELRERTELVEKLKQSDSQLSVWINSNLVTLRQQLKITQNEIKLLSKFKSNQTPLRGETWDQTL